MCGGYVITRDELIHVAAAKKLSLKNAEIDYLLEMTLFAICSEVKSKLALKGGTALYKFFSLPRFSEDLDFTLNTRRLNVEKLFKKILTNFGAADIFCKVTELTRHRTQINIRLSFRGPLYDGRKESLASIRINISMREKPVETEKRLLTPYYAEIPAFEVCILHPSELLAEKIRALLTRNKARDMFDIWFLLKRGIRPDFTLINKKLKIYKMKFSCDEFIKKVDETANLWESELKGLIIGSLPEFDSVKKEVIENLKAEVKK
jgi:predicted nucleotidyltransferase component of viral defense system